MMTIATDRMLRLGGRVLNLAHVSRIEFHTMNAGNPPAPIRMASVTFAGGDDGWAFVGKDVEELDEFLGGRFA